MRHEEIPGGHAVFRERTELRGKDRNLIEAAMMAAVPIFEKIPEAERDRRPGETTKEYSERLTESMKGVHLSLSEALLMTQLREASVIATLHSWTLAIPLPATIEALGELPDEIYQALLAAVSGVDLSATNFDPVDPRSPEFEASPTSPSSASAGPSREEDDTQSIPPQRNGTEAIAIVESSPP